jgi:Galactose-3-O-sulfotransferase
VGEGKPTSAPREQSEHFDIDRFLDSGNPELSNLQTKMLLGRGSYHIDLRDPDLIVEKATEVLETKLLCFGLTECFEESLMLFRKSLGWENWPVYTKLNTKNEAHLIVFSERHLCQIRELNELDMRVYDVATELFTQRAQKNVDYMIMPYLWPAERGRLEEDPETVMLFRNLQRS